MGVLSKALRIPVLVGVVTAVSGCAVNRSASGIDQSYETQAASENAAQQVAESNALESTNPGAEVSVADRSAAAAGELSTEELLAKSGSGIGVAAERGAGFSRYTMDIGGDEPLFNVQMIDSPARLVVDVLGLAGQENQEVALANDPFLKSVRVGGHKDRTRLVFDLRDSVDPSSVEHQVDSATGKITVTLKSPTVGALASAPAAALVDETAAEVKADSIAPVAELPSSEVAADNMVAEVIEPAAKEEVVAKAVPTEAPRGEVDLSSLKFEKGGRNAGQVLVELNDKTAYELRRTAPSEYTLTLAGTSASERTTIPQIAPKGFPGIRSARAVQEGENTVVRMFVDQGVDLRAVTTEGGILVKADSSLIAKNPEARAQLEVGDQPQGAAATPTTTPAAAAAAANSEAGAELKPAPDGLRSADGSKIYVGRLISLDLQDTDIDNALRIIAEVSNLNIIASDDVTGKVTLRLIDVPWDQALDVILKTNGLDQVTEGNVIRIAPVDKLRQEREALKEAKKAAENLEDLTVNYIRVSYARAADIKEQVESVLSERGSVATDERTNQLIIKDIKKGHVESDQLLKKLDLRTPQVLLETQIVEGSRNILRDMGFQWNFNYSQSPQTGNATGLNFPNSIGVNGDDGPGGNMVNFPAIITDTGSAVSAILDSADGSRSLAARLSAIEEEGKAKVISRPQIATVNNKQAEIKSVETVRVRVPDSGTSIATGQGAAASGGGASAFEEIDVGIELRVTPQASPDYYVLLDIEAKSSTFGSRPAVDGIPSTIERQATSTILVKSGQTFALGGVYRIKDSDTVQGVPFLKDVPFLGYLFRRQALDKSDEELIFFITPHIVEGSFDPSLM